VYIKIINYMASDCITFQVENIYHPVHHSSSSFSLMKQFKSLHGELTPDQRDSQTEGEKMSANISIIAKNSP